MAKSSETSNDQDQQKNSQEKLETHPKGIKPGEKGDALENNKIIQLTPDQLKQEISDAVEKKIGQIKSAVGGERLRGEQIYDEGEIDESDYLKDPVVFFAYSSFFRIQDDRRMGQNVMIPYGKPIRFKRLYRYHKRGGSRYDTQTISVCQGVVRSKKIADWLRRHTLFDVRFFETLNDARNVDHIMAEKLTEITLSLNSMTQHEILNRAKAAVEQEGAEITMSSNVDQVKKQLSFHMVQKQMKASQSRGEKMMTKGTKEKPIMMTEKATEKQAEDVY